MFQAEKTSKMGLAFSSPLARRLQLEISVLVIALLTVVSIGATITQVRQEFSRRDQSVQYAIDAFSGILIDSMWNLEERDIIAAHMGLLENHYVSAVLSWNEHGALQKKFPESDEFDSIRVDDKVIVAAYSEEGVDGFDGYKFFWVPLRHEPYARPNEAASETIGTLLLVSKQATVWQEVRSLIFAILSLNFLGVALVAVLIMILVARRIVEPLNTLAQALQKMNPKEDDVGVVLPDWPEELGQAMKPRRDEVGQLFHSFDEFRLALIDRDQRLLAYQKDLEARVDARTENLKAANAELESTLQRLQETQEDLVQSEKMASLGGLVSGVAHEVNTPLGVSVTAASHLADEVEMIAQGMNSGSLKKSQLENFIEIAEDSSAIILSNLHRAAELIHSFKQVAVDQSSEEARTINLVDYVQEVLRSLHPRLKKTLVQVTVRSDSSHDILTYPGALAQIVTNLVLNAIIHAFKDGKNAGEITIDVESVEGYSRLVIIDNGIGMDAKTREHIFEPFFTTRRGSGGSGLGLNIVYNLVTRRLNGRIHCESELGHFTRFVIEFPPLAAEE